MKSNLVEWFNFFVTALDAVPSPMLILDGDLRMTYWNTAALRFVGQPDAELTLKRTGDAIRCLNALNSDGCGHSEACRSCVIRGSVNESLSGRAVHRRKHRMKLQAGDEVQDLHLLVTTAPFNVDGEHHSILILEDLSELIQLQSLLPICVKCKKIRNDQNYWDNVEEYFERHLDIDFSHGMCPECSRELYPEVFGKQASTEI
jgi:hypothetical protein